LAGGLESVDGEPVEPPGRPAAGGDDPNGDVAPDAGKDPLRFNNWMKRSAAGAVMTGIAVGLQEALEPRRKEVPFVIEADGQPDDPDAPILLKFDPDSPADTVAIIRRPVTSDRQTTPPPAD
jgi:hypothetical protein